MADPARRTPRSPASPLLGGLSEKDWTDILAGLSVGDANDPPCFVAFDECYCLSRRDCKKMAQQLVRHFNPPNAKITGPEKDQ